ncbi:hypothetical protein [Micromonospora sp. NPDC051141]|uniref:hypothetical protein n=1 Tax=Micromonospora sp. NPDC051141 TaxID=3364284 RepID=UPI00379BF945
MAAAIAGAVAFTIVAAPTPASAALPDGYRVETSRDGDSLDMQIVDGAGRYIGWAEFNADPWGDTPGDAIRAHDISGDGLGVEAWLDIDPGSSFQADRIASTRGHTSPYATPWITGNIAEGTRVGLRICLVQGATIYCSGTQYTYA